MAIQKEKFKGKMRYRFSTYYDTPDGIHRRKGSKWYNSKKEAEAAEREFLSQPVQAEKKGRTFSKLMDEWILESGRDNTAATRDDKRRILTLYCQTIMDKNVFSITSADIRVILEDEHFSTLSSYRKNKLYTDLNGYLEYGCVQWGLPRNPLKGFPRYKQTTQEKLKEVEILDRHQFAEFLAAIPDNHQIYRDLFFWLYWTGMRANEAMSLTFADIKRGRAKVWRQWDKDTSEFKQLKTKGSVRTVQLDDDLLDVVDRLRNYYETSVHFSEDWFIFGGPRQLAYTTVQRIKNKALDDAGLPRVKIHSFRHSHASNLIDAGVPLFKISKRLGHSSVSMTTDIYGHLIREDDDDIMNAMKFK